ncbi:glucosyltransferase [Rhodotorula mucilaginosa]|uniref:Dol-P-Glc:Glc(2)Man(9)GlcNAc(2)-PP-Dol alpha-1,2-glucosyltransferase n=1 Tax=Rhodotorula mucilaginosa TaxID=5537 RepID=A0A9P6VUM0_RHOMI|nr:glucosyltransferase [Rhodotorula mucilaginosa]
MERRSSVRWWWAAYLVWAAASTHVALCVDRSVPEPYMDEIFHVPQTQNYCDGQWSHWDPALTTPPGLYLIPAALAHLRRQLPLLKSFTPDPCSLAALRATNLVLSFSLPFLYSSLLALLLRSRPGASPRRPTYAWEGLVIAGMPMLGWWAWMFYTDLASVVAVLLSWRFALQRRYLPSALLGAISLLFRQTNIVWVAFVAAQALIDRLRLFDNKKGDFSSDPLLRDARPADLVTVPLKLLSLALQDLPALTPVLASYVPVFAAAIAFVRWNGGHIVLGDKSNHVPTVHVAQVWYFLAFAAFFFSPHLLGVSQVKQSISGSLQTPSRIVGSILALGLILYSIHNYTVAHPFLLADNRHYAFYLWRRIINLHPYARYALAPGYFVAGRLLWIQLARAGRMTVSTLILLLGATCAVLIPSPLLEPRYFLTSLLILRLYLSPSPSISSSSSSSSTYTHRLRRRLLLEAVLYLAVQAVCVWLFLERPFKWEFEIGADGKGLQGRDERELGRWQRFMW